jgi:hypothetical protein
LTTCDDYRYFLSPDVIRVWIRTPKLGIASQSSYHCATTAGQALKCLQKDVPLTNALAYSVEITKKSFKMLPAGFKSLFVIVKTTRYGQGPAL